ncbi:unnamed protein product, partial [Brachionus calyciflorus]
MSDRMPKLNRNASMVLNSSGYNSLNVMENSDEDASPLKLFSRARQAMNSVFQEFNYIITEINNFIDLPEVLENNLIDEKEIQNLKTYKEKCDGLMKMITRD